MIGVYDRAVGGNGDIILDGDIALADDVRALFDADSITDFQRRVPPHLWAMNDFNSGKIPNVTLLPNEDSLSTRY